MCILSAAQRKIINQKRNNIFSLKRCIRRVGKTTSTRFAKQKDWMLKSDSELKFRACARERWGRWSWRHGSHSHIQKVYNMKAKNKQVRLVNPTEKMNINKNCIHKYKHEKTKHTHTKQETALANTEHTQRHTALHCDVGMMAVSVLSLTKFA